MSHRWGHPSGTGGCVHAGGGLGSHCQQLPDRVLSLDCHTACGVVSLVHVVMSSCDVKVVQRRELKLQVQHVGRLQCHVVVHYYVIQAVAAAYLDNYG